MAVVSLPDAVTGPALQTTQIINAKWDKASKWFDLAFGFGEKAIADIGAAPSMVAPTLNQSFKSNVKVPSLPVEDAQSVVALFDAKNSELSALIDDAFERMLEIAFPDMAVMAKALAWCDRAIAQGGTGINANVETALWERDRARVLKQAQQDLAAVQEKYARAGWPLPPGAMLHESAAIRHDSRNKLAEQSREIAIKSFDTEVENVRFAVKTVGDLFNQALNAVGEYVKTVMMGPQTAAQLATSISGLQNEAARTLVALYQAQTAALDPFVKLSVTDAQLKDAAEQANLRAKTETAQMRVQAALSNVKMVGDAAAASFNSIHAGVGNNMSTSISM